MSISGGGFRSDGSLWLSGHDPPELYVVRLPQGRATLDHIATVAMEAEGQAIDWDERGNERVPNGPKATNEFLRIILNCASGAAEKGK